ncbi:hypothetical protein BS47DRAFT_1391946 [Hydnum rufescens UP504]|uniref:NAD-dependent epimerase/dehydratase domain-containing protein n=1 Tax=Hydnum rufescens UP504 TaxID=1448309 RepID=A0A9P6AZR9_9AGAM|nr:hypothetical protein BS47DRAFT_1391946 [Hydnum rufescens UP504]
MVAITSGKILVTGGAGYIGAWVIKSAIDRGYIVVAAVRNDDQGDEIVNSFPEYKGKVSYTLVTDITKEGAYDEAVKDVDAVMHVASPVVWKWEDPSEIIGPAVKGTLGILNSAQKFGTNVKRVIFTSSAVAIHNYVSAEPGQQFDETNWNDISPAHVERDGKNSNPWEVYNASKTIAEKSAWTWVKETKPKFDVTAVLPVFCFGPHIHNAKKRLGSTPAILLSTLPAGDTSGKWTGDVVDVRDIALIHILSLEVPEAGGERIAGSETIFAWQDIYDVLNDAGYPNIPGKDTKGAGLNKATTRVSNAKSLKLFKGFQYRSFNEYIKEMGATLHKDGFFTAPPTA